ncbi:MAG: hypothetical protein ACFB9N_15495 [Geitlerinemataceae cyanobacterium]
MRFRSIGSSGSASFLAGFYTSLSTSSSLSSATPDIKFTLRTEVGRSLVLSCLIVRIDEDFPRLTNTYPI